MFLVKKYNLIWISHGLCSNINSHSCPEFGELFQAVERSILLFVCLFVFWRGGVQCIDKSFTELPCSLSASSWYLHNYVIFHTSLCHLSNCIHQRMLGGFSMKIILSCFSQAQNPPAFTHCWQTKFLPNLAPPEHNLQPHSLALQTKKNCKSLKISFHES